jgi:phosphonate transport system substrate-binding protein
VTSRRVDSRRWGYGSAALLLLALTVSPARAVTGEVTELQFGSVAMDIPASMYRRLKPLTDYLTQELKRPVTLKLSADLSRAVDEIAAGSVDIAYLTPVAYIRAQKSGNVRLVAKTVTQGRSALRLMIVTRAASPIRSVSDLAGKSFAFGDEAAILQRAVVVNAGIRLEQLAGYKYLGHYDNIARGVANGDFDAGILKDTTAYEWEKKGLRTIHTSPELPPYNIVVSRRVDDRLYHAIQAALLRLNSADPEHHKVVKALDPGYDGFASASDAEYNVVRELVKPFEK